LKLKFSDTYLLVQIQFIIENVEGIYIHTDKDIVIKFTLFFDEPVDFLPEGITHIIFGNFFNQSIDKLPNTVKCIALWAYMFLKGTIKFGYSFNQTINCYSESLICIFFGDEFNKPVDNLPNTITKLIFGRDFDQLINNLPKNIISLGFGRDFNQPIHDLPDTITHLRLGKSFNQSLDKLPKSLIDLTMYDISKNLSNIPKINIIVDL
jgi:hypothetical protein